MIARGDVFGKQARLGFVCRVPSPSFCLSLGALQCGVNGCLLRGFLVIWFLVHCTLWLGSLKPGGGSGPAYTCAGRGGGPSYYSS